MKCLAYYFFILLWISTPFQKNLITIMKLSKKVALINVSLLLAICNHALCQPAQKPPMGWNSYNCFGSAVHEDEVRANTDYMDKNLKKFGWQYIVIDFLWSYDNPPGSNIGNPFQLKMKDGSLVPWLTMDKWGRLMPQPNKFPSAWGGKGFKSDRKSTRLNSSHANIS